MLEKKRNEKSPKIQRKHMDADHYPKDRKKERGKLCLSVSESRKVGKPTEIHGGLLGLLKEFWEGKEHYLIRGLFLVLSMISVEPVF